MLVHDYFRSRWWELVRSRCVSAMLWFSVSFTVATTNAWFMASAAALLVEGTVEILDLQCYAFGCTVVRAPEIASSASIVSEEVGRYIGTGLIFSFSFSLWVC